jgi:hypothetical protein
MPTLFRNALEGLSRAGLPFTFTLTDAKDESFRQSATQLPLKDPIKTPSELAWPVIAD